MDKGNPAKKTFYCWILMQRTLAVSRFGNAYLYAAILWQNINKPSLARFGLLFSPFLQHFNVYYCFWQPGWYTHRRLTSYVILYGRYSSVDIFFNLFNHHLNIHLLPMQIFLGRYISQGLTVPVSIVISNLIQFAIQFGLLIALWYFIILKELPSY